MLLLLFVFFFSFYFVFVLSLFVHSTFLCLDPSVGENPGIVTHHNLFVHLAWFKAWEVHHSRLNLKDIIVR